MQRLLTAALVVVAGALSAGGVAFSVRADPPQRSAAAPAPDQCSTAVNHAPVRINARAAALAAQDDMVPLNTQGYNYSAYDNQWRPETSAAAPASPAPSAPPASPAKR